MGRKITRIGNRRLRKTQEEVDNYPLCTFLLNKDDSVYAGHLIGTSPWFASSIALGIPLQRKKPAVGAFTYPPIDYADYVRSTTSPLYIIKIINAREFANRNERAQNFDLRQMNNDILDAARELCALSPYHPRAQELTETLGGGDWSDLHVHGSYTLDDLMNNEADILRACSHPCIPCLHEAFRLPGNPEFGHDRALVTESMYTRENTQYIIPRKKEHADIDEAVTTHRANIITSIMDLGILSDALHDAMHASPSIDLFRHSSALVSKAAHALLSGLRYLHDKGIRHNDLKPENAVCDLASGRTHIIDFGLARRASDPAQVTGNRTYAPPERYTGTDHPAYDAWAIGMMLYTLMRGHHALNPEHERITWNDERGYNLMKKKIQADSIHASFKNDPLRALENTRAFDVFDLCQRQDWRMLKNLYNTASKKQIVRRLCTLTRDQSASQWRTYLHDTLTETINPQVYGRPLHEHVIALLDINPDARLRHVETLPQEYTT